MGAAGGPGGTDVLEELRVAEGGPQTRPPGRGPVALLIAASTLAVLLAFAGGLSVVHAGDPAGGIRTAAAPAPEVTVLGERFTDTTDGACRNSTDPACGPFRFDPQPGADSPMTVGVTFQPVAPVAGQTVVFHLVLHDADGVSHRSSLYGFGDSGVGDATFDECRKFGVWGPPARDPARASETHDVTHVYAKAGTYTASFSFDAGPFECVDAVTGRGDRPYASSAVGTVTVVVK